MSLKKYFTNTAKKNGRISIGDKAIIDSGFIELMGNSVCSGAMDNRAGVTAVLYALKKIDRTKLKYNIKILFSSEEELGLHGGYTGTLDTTADAAIVVDVTHGMTPDSKDMVGVFKLGCGAVICRGPNLSFKHTKKLIELADKQDIPYEIEADSQRNNRMGNTDEWRRNTRNACFCCG